MGIFARLLLALLLFALTAFCAFGFLACFEPPGAPLLRIAYAIGGVLSLGGAVWLLVPTKSPGRTSVPPG